MTTGTFVKLKLVGDGTYATMAMGEMVTLGGEASFVERLIDDSSALGANRVGWNSALIGRRKSLRKILAALRARREDIRR